jgi:hypothetical protein
MSANLIKASARRMYLVPQGQHDRTVPPGQKPFGPGGDALVAERKVS